MESFEEIVYSNLEKIQNYSKLFVETLDLIFDILIWNRFDESPSEITLTPVGKSGLLAFSDGISLKTFSKRLVSSFRVGFLVGSIR